MVSAGGHQQDVAGSAFAEAVAGEHRVQRLVPRGVPQPQRRGAGDAFADDQVHPGEVRDELQGGPHLHVLQVHRDALVFGRPQGRRRAGGDRSRDFGGPGARWSRRRFLSRDVGPRRGDDEPRQDRRCRRMRDTFVRRRITLGARPRKRKSWQPAVQGQRTPPTRTRPSPKRGPGRSPEEKGKRKSWQPAVQGRRTPPARTRPSPKRGPGRSPEEKGKRKSWQPAVQGRQTPPTRTRPSPKKGPGAKPRGKPASLGLPRLPRIKMSHARCRPAAHGVVLVGAAAGRGVSPAASGRAAKASVRGLASQPPPAPACTVSTKSRPVSRTADTRP